MEWSNSNALYGELSNSSAHVVKRIVELQPIEDEREHSGLRSPIMAENEHCNISNESRSKEETKGSLISTISLDCRLYALGADTQLDFSKKNI